MGHPRMAFAAEYWGNEAVICRAMEDSVGCAVVQEFGTFLSWTEANSFASRLNEGLGVTREEAREIVTGALLASNDLTQPKNRENLFRSHSPAIARAQVLHLHCIAASLQLARTYCQLSRCMYSSVDRDPLLKKAGRFLNAALRRLPQIAVSSAEAEEVAARIARLLAELEGSSGVDAERTA
jgi:hypothetical protein